MKLEERTKLNFSGIYLLKNTISGHCYIGQARNINRRIYEHLYSTINPQRSDYNYPIHIAMRKYGIDNFELVLLEQCTIVELNKKEEFWVKKYNTKTNGYNQTNGGYQSIRHIKLTKEDVESIKTLLVLNKLTNAELAKKFNVSTDVIQRINTGRMWRDDNHDYPIRRVSIKTSHHFSGIGVAQVDPITNEILKKFPSISIAAKTLCAEKDISGQLSRCCNGKAKTVYGYKWQFISISEKDWLKLLEEFVV